MLDGGQEKQKRERRVAEGWGLCYNKSSKNDGTFLFCDSRQVGQEDLLDNKLVLFDGKGLIGRKLW